MTKKSSTLRGGFNNFQLNLIYFFLLLGAVIFCVLNLDALIKAGIEIYQKITPISIVSLISIGVVGVVLFLVFGLNWNFRKIDFKKLETTNDDFLPEELGIIED